MVVAQAVADKRGRDVTVMDVSKASTIADQFIVVTANSDIHMGTLCDAAGDVLDELNVDYTVEGQTSSQWRLLDAGNLLVHVFSSKGREFYDLERVWGDHPSYRLENVD
ncbi:MAG: ribosome silencing factor [Dethiosulfovibrio peptidovorans]|nr:MAG: ribosome silencing factor [Dethiosulfovibrio peptidovorans]